MTDFFFILFVLLVTIMVFNPLAWASNKKQLREMYGEAPWNWRVFLGPWAYLNWMDRRSGV